MLKVHQYLPEEELNSKRQQQLDRLFNLAKVSTGYYSQFNSYDEVPELNKQVMKKNPNDFLSSSYKGKLFKKFTGGTTGTPFPYHTSALSQSFLWAGLILSWESCGYNFGDRIAFIAGSALIKTGTKHKIFYSLLNVDRYPVASMDDAIIKKHLAGLRQRNTKVIYGYAMAINLIADYMLQNNLPPIEGLKGIICTSEVLTDKMRENIEKAFKIKVYNQYGCNEAGLSAFECEKGSMHLITSRCMYEINADGELVSTDLTNDAYPFIKYNTGDIVQFGKNHCSCGRHYPVITNIEGRGNELLVDMENKKIHSSYFNLMFKNDKAIKQFQVIFDETSVYLNLMVEEGFDKKQQYLNLIKKNFTFDRYVIKTNEQFHRGSNLKHTFIVDKRKKQAIKAA
jgi:phenylacetate-CoA ligase